MGVGFTFFPAPKFHKEKEKEKKRRSMKKAPAKKMAAKKTKIDRICDLVDCWIDSEMTRGEFEEKLFKLVGRPIIKISEMEYIVQEWKGNLYLEGRAQFKDGCYDNWCQIEDLTDFTVGECNDLVSELHKHYPDYPIEHLEGRFV